MTGSALIIPLLSHWKCLLITLAVDSRFLKHLRKRQMLVHVKSEQPWISLETKSAPAQHPWVVCMGNRFQKTLRHLIFINFFSHSPYAISLLKWFISVSIRLHSPLCFGACSGLTFQLLSCLQHLFQYLVCWGMLRLCPPLAYLVSGIVDEKKIILWLSEWLSGKIIFPGSLCANICLVLCSCSTVFAVFLKAPGDILRDLSDSEQ